jgi:D-sedoheptulose 7-phosphate isomerase
MTPPPGQDAGETAGKAAGKAAGGIESLYPFLYAGSTDSATDRAANTAAVLDQVRASTVAKVAEIAELRQAVAQRDAGRLAECAAEAAARFAAGGRLFAFGNGGSATDAQQLATLFLNPGHDSAGHDSAGRDGAGRDGAGRDGAAREWPPLPAFSLASDTSVLTALANDVGVEVVFARQLGAFGTKNDIAVGLSTSGNSANLVRAFDEAARRGMLTVGLAGYDGGKMAELDSIDYLFVAPSSSVHRIQEAQTTTYHVLWELTATAVQRARSEGTS